ISIDGGDLVDHAADRDEVIHGWLVAHPRIVHLMLERAGVARLSHVANCPDHWYPFAASSATTRSSPEPQPTESRRPQYSPALELRAVRLVVDPFADEHVVATQVVFLGRFVVGQRDDSPAEPIVLELMSGLDAWRSSMDASIGPWSLRKRTPCKGMAGSVRSERAPGFRRRDRGTSRVPKSWVLEAAPVCALRRGRVDRDCNRPGRRVAFRTQQPRRM